MAAGLIGISGPAEDRTYVLSKKESPIIGLNQGENFLKLNIPKKALIKKSTFG